MRIALASLLAFALCAAGCSSVQKSARVGHPADQPATGVEGDVLRAPPAGIVDCGAGKSHKGTLDVPKSELEGLASYYGEKYDGRLTASGDVFDMHKLSAAHRTLRLGTKVRVTNMDNGRSLEVCVNDRGPFAKDRILDLSYAAAKELGVLLEGSAPVRIEIIGKER